MTNFLKSKLNANNVKKTAHLSPKMSALEMMSLITFLLPRKPFTVLAQIKKGAKISDTFVLSFALKTIAETFFRPNVHNARLIATKERTQDVI